MVYFLQDSRDRSQILARILQESCKIFLLVIEHSFLQESCKNAIASKNLDGIELFCTNLARYCKILQELNFLSTRDIPFESKNEVKLNDQLDDRQVSASQSCTFSFFKYFFAIKKKASFQRNPLRVSYSQSWIWSKIWLKSIIKCSIYLQRNRTFYDRFFMKQF